MPYLLLSLFFLISPLSGYEKPAAIEEATWEVLLPYLMPEDHPQKLILDRLFKPSRNPLESLAEVKFAGFQVITQNPRNGLIIAKHPKLKGKIIKAFPEDSSFEHEELNFLRRVKGSCAVRNAIRNHGWESEFVSPQKWIYPLLERPGQTRYFILVVDEVTFPPEMRHLVLWKSGFVTKDLLNKLYTLIKEAGMADSVFIDNIPITKRGKIAFIDTEHYHNWGIPWKRLTPYLSPLMQVYWQQITNP